MLTYLRYALATFCFAASVACLALWWRSMAYSEDAMGKNALTAYATIYVEWYRGMIRFALLHDNPNDPFPIGWQHSGYEMDDRSRDELDGAIYSDGRFLIGNREARFPLWYPALVFALAGVAFLRLGRRFTIRSAIIATTVVAVLLGMVVIL